MKIGIVAPSPVPFNIGGAENVYWGLLNQINRGSPHQAELIKLPTPETEFWALMAGYQRFYELDMSHFDLVISAKYPAWMVQHDRHVCYMLHRLRGVYDTYHLTGCPKTCVTDHGGVKKCLEFMQQTRFSRNTVPELMDRLAVLRSDDTVPPELFAFPGPFSRTVIHYLDGTGLTPDRISKYAAISKTVAGRKNYFPGTARVQVIYPPSNLDHFTCLEDRYLFTVSRLDSPKRIQLLIEAMARVKADIALKIAGTGPDEDRLRAMAAGDPRIEFLGFVKDRQIIDLYADALAVPYVPYDEDYGLVTIEAMMSVKPVITVTDAGGPVEFVKNGVTGFCVPPDPGAIAEKIDYLCRHREDARRMGKNGYEQVSHITWPQVVSELLDQADTSSRRPVLPVRPRKKLTVAVTFPVFPPRGGGQARVFNLYRHLASWWDIDIVTLTHSGDAPFKGLIAPGVTEIRIPKTPAHESEETRLSLAAGQVPVTDAAMPRLYHLTPDYADALKASAAGADAVVASHPYLVDALTACAPGKPLWYEAHNVEIDLKEKILSASDTAQALLEETRAVERRCWKESELVYACTRTDLDRLAQVYGNTRAVRIEVPNGVTISDIPFTPLSRRRTMKTRLGVPTMKIALFIGSWHGPNLEAIAHIIGFAKNLPRVMFLVLGSGGLAFGGHDLPPNLGMAGVVAEDMKAEILSMADVALNPMTSGSGTNLKMLEYFAAGVPVISTSFGMRGLGCEPGKDLLIADIASFPDTINRFFTCPADTVQKVIDSAHTLAVEKFDWPAIAQKMHAQIHNHFKMAFNDPPSICT